eukprot:gb/GECG01009606.1/.p1 GENE.gb/GECG01009606.1/~~gb/GECG01009606.1/.p1  ORF type:complete len:140 (+),score=9.55 gb/GECG01009606.1/:1-420(+)
MIPETLLLVRSCSAKAIESGTYPLGCPNCAGDVIPSDPQATHKPLVEDESLRETFVGKEMSRPRHIEGYTGHVPGAREEPLGITFGRYSEQVLRRPMDAKDDRKILKSQPKAGFSYARSRPKPQLEVPDKGLDLRYNTG